MVRPSATPYPWSARELSLDAAVPALAGAATIYLGSRALANAGDAGPAPLALIAAMAVVPPAAMVYAKERALPLDDYFAGLSGGLLGFAVGFAAGRALAPPLPDQPLAAFSPLAVVALAVGQGLGASLGLHGYRALRATLPDLDRLRNVREYDPIDNWQIRRERRNP